MFSRIVVPLDGSPFAEAALAPARMLAKAFGSSMLIVRAEPSTGLPFVVQTDSLQADWERLADADAYLQAIVSQLRAEGFDADLTLFVSEAGSGIARAVELSHADAIVMASHLRWMLPPDAHPSTTLSVLARSRVPMFVCRSRVGADAGGDGSAGASAAGEIVGADAPIIVPLDGSRLAEAALPYASALARVFGSYLMLLRVIESTDLYDFAEERQAADYLQAVREEIAQSGGHAVTMVRRGAPVTGIEAAWRQSNAGLIVMASHGQSGPSHRFLGSVTARMIEEIEASVVVIHPQGVLAATATVRRDEAW